MAKSEAAPAALPPPVAPEAAASDPAPAAADGPAPDSSIPSPAPAVSIAAPAQLSEPAAGESVPASSVPQSLPAPSIQLSQPGLLSAPPASQPAPPAPQARLQQQLPASPSVSPPVPMATPGGNGDAPPDEDILDIRGPIHIEAPFPWIPWTAGAAGTALVAFLLWKGLRRPRRAVPPWRLALEKLAASRALMDSGNAQPFSHAVSEIVRSFIEQSFPVRAAHRTTSEFLHDLVKLPNSPLAAHRATLAEFLESCDLAKFACWSLTLPEMEAMLSKAQNFISSIGKTAAAVPPGPSAPEPAAVPEVRRA